MDNNQNPNIQNNVSKGELFVGMNILSKIGVVFIIIGIIAFSATSGDYLSEAVRLGMVLVLGGVMLAGGELFRKFGSVVFANALSFGAIIELFVCVPLGRYGFDVWNGTVAQFIGLAVFGVGFFLSIRYKSQALLVITQTSAILPIFAADENMNCAILTTLISAFIHILIAFYSRRRNYDVAASFGLYLGFIQSIIFLFLFADASRNAEDVFDKDYCIFVVLIYQICITISYAGGIFLNAAEKLGKLFAWEAVNAVFAIIFQSITLNICIYEFSDNETANGIANVVFAAVLLIIMVMFELHSPRCGGISSILINTALISYIIGIPMIWGDEAVYITYHISAVALLAVGVYTNRRLLTVWGFIILGISELMFIELSVWADNRVLIILTNLILWFALMAVYIISKKHSSTGFHLYTCAAFLNAGILFSVLIKNDFTDYLTDKLLFENFEANFLALLISACVWMILGYILGKLSFLKLWGMGSSILFYATGMMFLFASNMIGWFESSPENEFGALPIVVMIVVNIISVLTVFDLTKQIMLKQPKFEKAVGLVVSGYALLALTSMLGINDALAFTSWVISVIYISMAAAWIIVGFIKNNALLRRFGLALALLASAKLFLFDFRGIDAMGRTLLFIGFGITLLAISFGYGIAESKLKNNQK